MFRDKNEKFSIPVSRHHLGILRFGTFCDSSLLHEGLKYTTRCLKQSLRGIIFSNASILKDQNAIVVNNSIYIVNSRKT